MRPLSVDRHKTLLEVGGRTIIDRIIDALLANGVKDVCLVTGYRADEVEAHVVLQFPQVHFTFVRNDSFHTTNNVYSLALALEQVPCDDDVLLIESDLIFDPAVLARLLASPHPNAALLDRYRVGMDGTVVSISGDGIITQVIPSSLQDEHFDFSDKYKTLNIYKFSAQFCRETFCKLLTYYARVIDNNCYYELILGILIYMGQVRVHAELLDGEPWAELDDPNDLRGAEFVFAPSRRHELLESSWGGYWNTPAVDFAFIRNVHFPTPAMLSELRASLPDLLRNYGSAQHLLDTKLAYFLLCEPSRLKVLNGASQLFPWLKQWFAGVNVLVPAPTFGEYHRAFPYARSYKDWPGPEKVGIDLGEIEEMAPSRGLVVFVNPNNPTGSTIPTKKILFFARCHPELTILVDESFIEFSGELSAVHYLEEAPLDNVIVLKSLSKSLGVPGVRLGFVYSSARAFIAHVESAMPVWNLNSIAEYFLELLLKHRRELEESFSATIRDRATLAEELVRLRIVASVIPSGANFLLVRSSLTRESLQRVTIELLARELIYLKDVSAKFDDGHSYWRIAVRSAAENSRLCQVLAEPWVSSLCRELDEI